MKVLVANIGSQSFKFRLFDFVGTAEAELARGGVDRIGEAGGTLAFAPSGKDATTKPCVCADAGAAIKACLAELVSAGVLAGPRDLEAVAFKAVMAGDCAPVAFVDDKLLAAMEYYAPAAPAHNPAYVSAMRSFRRTLAGVPLVAAFETGFHRDIPPRRRWYAVPAEWEKKYGIRRYGYHGASHRYVAWRLNQLMGRHARKVVSLHLGGSSSLCAIRDGVSVATSMGFSPQSGVPQSRRVGDFDSFALSLVARETHQSLDAMLAALGSSGGLASMSGTSGDFRDIAAAADAGDARAKLARDVFVTSVRDYLGAYLVELGGADVIVFTGGIGQNSSAIRSAVCRGMDFMGILLDDAKNALAKDEARIDSAGSKTAIWVLPANEELIVARQAVQLLRDYGMVREDKNAIGDW